MIHLYKNNNKGQFKLKADYKKINSILTYTSIALKNPEIIKDKDLVVFLTIIQEEAKQNRIFYDYKRKFRPTVTCFTIDNNFEIPDCLVKLLSVVETPKAWSGFSQNDFYIVTWEASCSNLVWIFDLLERQFYTNYGVFFILNSLMSSKNISKGQ